MAPQRPCSPTSMLWAHQLRREHQHLLVRMQGLESSNEKHENRIKGAEAAAKSMASGEVATLSTRIQNLEQSGLDTSLFKLEENVTHRLDEVEGDTESLTHALVALENSDRQAKEETKLVLEGIREAKEELKKYESSLKALGEVVVPQQIAKVEERLDTLATQISGQGGELTVFREDVQKLEEVNAYLKKKNAKLEEDVRRMGEREQGRQAKRRKISNGEEVQVEATPVAGEASAKKKSHKWGGGGADRDIIRQGEMMSERSTKKAKSSATSESGIQAATRKAPAPASTKNPHARPPMNKLPAPAKRAPPILKKTANKSSAPNTSSSPSVGERPAAARCPKAHRWTGGGAEKDIISSGMHSNLGRRQSRSSDTLEREPVVRAPRVSSDAEQVVRAGKGWVVLEEGSEDGNDDGGAETATARRGPGRPRKHPALADGSAPLRSHQAQRRSMYPSLRPEEADLLAFDTQTRQTRTQRRAQDVKTKSEPASDTGTAALKTAKAPPHGRQPRRRIAQSDSE